MTIAELLRIHRELEAETEQKLNEWKVDNIDERASHKN